MERSKVTSVAMPDAEASERRGTLGPELRLSVEDRGFLDDFGRRISIAAGSAGLVGGLGFYGMARQGLQGYLPCVSRHLGRRRGLWSAIGATVWPDAWCRERGPEVPHDRLVCGHQPGAPRF